jgi:hypothetical protein
MKKFVLCGVIVVFVAVALWSLTRSEKRPHFDSVDDMMQYLARDAVSMANKDHGIGLDFGEKSIMDVEKILGTLHEKYRVSHAKAGANGLALAYGAYIGEVIRRSAPGSKWEQDHAVVGRNSYPLHWISGEIFPCGWCYKRIVNGPEDNVWHKYILSKQARVGEE